MATAFGGLDQAPGCHRTVAGAVRAHRMPAEAGGPTGGGVGQGVLGRAYEVSVQARSISMGGPADRSHTRRDQALQFRAVELRRAFARR
jgi:hypothetical protein